MKEARQKERVPIYKKLNLTIEEAAEYSNIGEARIRELTKDPDCDFVLKKGVNTLIKRVKFERFLSEAEVI